MVAAAAVVVAAGGVGWRKAVGHRLEPFPFPACKVHRQFDLCREHRCRFELGKRSYRERRRPVPECESSSNQGSGAPEVRERATSP